MTDRQIAELVESIASKARAAERDLAECRRGLEDCIAFLKQQWRLQPVVVTDEQRREFAAQRKTFFVKRECVK